MDRATMICARAAALTSICLFAAACQDPGGVEANAASRTHVDTVTAGSAMPSAGPEFVALGSLTQTYQPVRFPHMEHARRTHSCTNCHHHATAQTETPACPVCHGQPFQDQARPGLKGAFHRQCMGCHQTVGRGPLLCEGCHKRRMN